MNTDSISQAIVKLFETERFYAEILCQMDRYVDKKTPVAGVAIRDKIELHINLENFGQLPLEQRVAVLKHECEHILRDHIARAKDIDPDVYSKKTDKTAEDAVINSWKHKILNVAMDLGINCQIPDIPEWGVFPKNFDLEDGQTMEWYLDHLKNNEKAKDLMEFDDHAIWGDSEESKDILREKVRQAIEKAAVKTRAAGKMTAEDELKVQAFNYKARDWKSDLKRFVARTIETVVEVSKKKRNRRYGTLYPGKIKTENLVIGVALDTSGSVSDEALSQFMAEVGNIAKYAQVIVVEADSEVKQSYTFDPRKQYTIKGRGGTAYQPALDFFSKEHEIDGLIYFGDMDCFDGEEIKKPKYPVLWAIVGEQEPPVNWGFKTKIEIHSK